MSIRYHGQVVAGPGGISREELEAALAGKQDKLRGCAGQAVGFDASGAAAAVQGWSNWNFVDNGGFDLWRNGTVFDASGLMYTADRWNNFWQKCRYERVDNPFPDCPCRYAIKATAGADEGLWATIRQPVTPELAEALDGHTVTISAWVMGQSQAPLVLAAGNVDTGYTIPLSTQPQRIVFTGIFDVGADSDIGAQGLAIFSALNGNNGAQAGDWYIITGIKLELGSAATPYVPKGLPLEYALCSQYSPVTGEWVGDQPSNPNLLDGWYLADPINQRGQKEYSGTGYTIDRWKIEGDLKVTLESGWLKVVNETDEDGWFIQCAEPSLMPELAGRAITHSAFCKGEGTNLTIYWGYVEDGNWHSMNWAQIPTNGSVCAPQFTTVFPEVADPEVFQICALGVYAHSTLWIKAAKVELGTRQTLAHQDAEGNWVLNDPPPNKALELAKCQRYAIDLVREEAAGDFLCVGNGLASETDLVPIFIPLPVPLRGAPSVSFSGDWRLVTDRYWEQGVPVAGLSHAYLAGNGVTVWARCAANSISIGKTYYLCGTGSSQKSLLLSSDL